MAGDNMEGGAIIPVGHRNTGIGKGRHGRGDTGHHLKGYTVLNQQLQLLAAPAEDKGITTLEPHHPMTSQTFLQQNPVDFLLRHWMIAGGLADVDSPGVFGNQLQNFIRHQPVIDHNLGLTDQLLTPAGEQAGISRSGPHQ